MNIVSWEYYNSHFPNLSEQEFNKNVYQVTAYVKNKLAFDYFTMDADDQTKVKDCICSLINSNTFNNNTLSSVSNDGYSESYITDMKQVKKIKNDILNEWIGHLLKRYECF